MVAERVETRPDFFVEIERGFLAQDDPLLGCALDDFSNLQILPDGRAYRCGLLVDRAGMSSLAMTVTNCGWLALLFRGRVAEVIGGLGLRYLPGHAGGWPARVHL
jgi:hypothetical protein